MRTKRIFSETSEVIKDLKDYKDAFIKRGYQSKMLDHHFVRAMSVDRKILKIRRSHLTFSTYLKKLLPNIKNVIDEHWHILSIKENLRKVFDKRPFIAYGRNTKFFESARGFILEYKKFLNYTFFQTI